MGSCASSTHKNSSGSVTKLILSPFRSKTIKIMIPPSPVKDKPANGITQIIQFGSKEEVFFDSQPWLESDCEDDFLSVNGEFTPSRGNTPVHHTFSMGTPQLIKGVEGDKTLSTETSPTEKKKKLSELFRECIREELNNDKQGNANMANGKIHELPPKSPYSSSYISGTNSMCSSERTVNGESIVTKEKSFKSVQCCLPSIVSCRFSERKKMTPARTITLSP